MKKVLTVLILGLVALGLSGCLSEMSNSISNTMSDITKSISESNAPINTKTSQICEEYKTFSYDAEQKYFNKFITVTGKVDKATVRDGFVMFDIYIGDEKHGVKAFGSSDDRDRVLFALPATTANINKARNIKSGQQLTATGKLYAITTAFYCSLWTRDGHFN